MNRRELWRTLVIGFFFSASPWCPAVLHAEWSAMTQSRMTYTDDVLQFSASRRQKFSEDPSQPTGVPVDKRADVVWDPSLEVVRSSSSSSLGPTEVSMKAHGFL